jgi:4-hydroxy-2-oxoheptanedioate aldolase
MIAEKRTAIGVILAFDSADVVELIARGGFDFVVIDCEHGPAHANDAVNMIRAAELGGMAALVRISSHFPHEALRFLDAGAAGIIFPHIESRADAEQIVSAVRFPPDGSRGLAPSTRAADYGLGVLKDYLRVANEELLVIPIVETGDGVAAIDDIAAVPGIDAIAIGAVDLAAAMGYAGDRTVPEVDASVRHVMARSKAAGKPVLLAAALQPQVKDALAAGATLVMVPFASWLVQTAHGFLRTIRSDP